MKPEDKQKRIDTIFANTAFDYFCKNELPLLFSDLPEGAEVVSVTDGINQQPMYKVVAKDEAEGLYQWTGGTTGWQEPESNPIQDLRDWAKIVEGEGITKSKPVTPESYKTAIQTIPGLVAYYSDGANDQVKQNEIDKEPKQHYSRFVRGYRNFMIDDGELCSCNERQHKWMPGINTAICTRGLTSKTLLERNPGHVAPDHLCKCGFYLMHDPKFLWSSYNNNRNAILACVVGWGKMQVANSGVRSQYAMIKSIAIDPMKGPKLAKQIHMIQELYPDVKIVMIQDFMEDAKRYGEILPPKAMPSPTAHEPAEPSLAKQRAQKARIAAQQSKTKRSAQEQAAIEAKIARQEQIIGGIEQQHYFSMADPSISVFDDYGKSHATLNREGLKKQLIGQGLSPDAADIHIKWMESQNES